VFGFVLSLLWLWRTFGATPPVATILRLGAAAAVLFGIDFFWGLPVELVAQHGKILYLGLVVAKMAVMGVAMLITLVVTREFTKRDLDRFKAVLGRG
jgi:hypothetical protein